MNKREQQLIERAQKRASEFRDIRDTAAILIVIAMFGIGVLAEKRKLLFALLPLPLLFALPLVGAHRRLRQWELFAKHVEGLAKSEAGTNKAWSELDQLDAVIKSIDPKFHKKNYYGTTPPTEL